MYKNDAQVAIRFVMCQEGKLCTCSHHTFVSVDKLVASSAERNAAEIPETFKHRTLRRLHGVMPRGRPPGVSNDAARYA